MVGAQYSTNKEDVYNAYYRLTNVSQQITAYVFDGTVTFERCAVVCVGYRFKSLFGDCTVNMVSHLMVTLGRIIVIKKTL